MSQRLDQKVTNKRLAKGKPIDWVCSLCKNYNYSFRVKCNRCHIQSRDTNHIAAHPIPMKNYDIMEADTKCEVCSGLQFPQMVLVALQEQAHCDEGYDEKKQQWDSSQWNWVKKIVD